MWFFYRASILLLFAGCGTASPDANDGCSHCCPVDPTAFGLSQTPRPVVGVSTSGVDVSAPQGSLTGEASGFAGLGSDAEDPNLEDSAPGMPTRAPEDLREGQGCRGPRDRGKQQ